MNPVPVPRVRWSTLICAPPIAAHKPPSDHRQWRYNCGGNRGWSWPTSRRSNALTLSMRSAWRLRSWSVCSRRRLRCRPAPPCAGSFGSAQSTPRWCIFHFEFEFCHPFSDGNGRMGRLWNTLLLSRWRPVLAWMPIESAIRRRQADYYEALTRSGAAGSSEDFAEFMLEAIREAILPYARPANAAVTERARALAFLSDNSRSTVVQLAQHLGCSKRSAERMVARLKEEGVLERQGSPRSGSWTVHVDHNSAHS